MDTSKLYALSQLPHNNSEENCDMCDESKNIQ